MKGVGRYLSSQGMILFDGDGDGVNESFSVTDDPTLPGEAHPTVITRGPLAVPILSPLGLIIFVLGLGLSAIFLKRRREA